MDRNYISRNNHFYPDSERCLSSGKLVISGGKVKLEGHDHRSHLTVWGKARSVGSWAYPRFVSKSLIYLIFFTSFGVDVSTAQVQETQPIIVPKGSWAVIVPQVEVVADFPTAATCSKGLQNAIANNQAVADTFQNEWDAALNGTGSGNPVYYMNLYNAAAATLAGLKTASCIQQ